MLFLQCLSQTENTFSLEISFEMQDMASVLRPVWAAYYKMLDSLQRLR